MPYESARQPSNEGLHAASSMPAAEEQKVQFQRWKKVGTVSDSFPFLGAESSTKTFMVSTSIMITKWALTFKLEHTMHLSGDYKE